MKKQLMRRDIESGVREMITVEETSLGVEVVTPVIYPDGDPAVVIVAPSGDGSTYRVHDGGMASYRLASEGVHLSREAAAKAANTVARYRCVFLRGSVEIESSADSVPTSVMLVANASRAIADLIVEVRRQSDDQFRYALNECVSEIAGKRARYNEIYKGASGRGYRVSNIILDELQMRPVAFIVPLASRSSVGNHFRELYDLKAAAPEIENETIYREESDFRPDEDGWVLRQVGNLYPFRFARTALAKFGSRSQ